MRLEEEQKKAIAQEGERERTLTDEDKAMCDNISDVKQQELEIKSDSVKQEFAELELQEDQNDLQDLDGNFDVNAEEEIFHVEEGQEEEIRKTMNIDHLTVDNEESKQFLAEAMKHAAASEDLEVESKPKASKKIKITGDVKVDSALIKAIWPYMKSDEDMVTDAQIAEDGAKIMQELCDELEIEMTKNNNKIKSINNESPTAEADSQLPNGPFELSNICNQGLEILTDCPIDFEDWSSTSMEQEWVIRTLKIWFFMIKDFAVIHKWASWPLILDDSAFIKKAADVIEENADEFYEYLMKNKSKLILDDMQHLIKVECLLKHLGGVSMVDPHHADGDSSVGTFIMFVLKDALIHAGIISSDKKRNPGKELRLCNAKKALYDQYYAQLQTALGF